MPYIWRPYWRRRRRYFRRWGARKAFRRRLWRRRRRTVRRKRKLKKIHIQQWQPSTIKRLTIRGEYPLFIGTNQRTGNNMTQYLDSIAPYNVPGGGLLSIIQFNLAALYELHQKARNWWTQSNCTLPLIRYLGCSVKLFRSSNVDYIFVYTRCGDLTATLKTYQACQPSVLMYNKHRIIVRCNANGKFKKNYKRVFIKPPSLMLNKWYFQQEIAQTPLVMFLTSAASLDRYYTPASAISETIGFYSLNTNFYKHHNFKTQLTTGYTPNDQWLIFTTDANTEIDKTPYKQLIYLGNSKDCQPGLSVARTYTGNATDSNAWNTHVDNYFATPAQWGNPFYPPYFHEEYPNYYITNKKLPEIKQKLKQNMGKDNITDFTVMVQPRYWHCRYTPQKDKSQNAVFFSPITGPPIPWENPHDARLTEEGLPLWLLFTGLIDYHAKKLDIQRLQTDYVTCIISDYITPHDQITYYVPFDEQFLHQRSPYEPIGDSGILLPYDRLNYHPKVNYQLLAINEFVNTGPGTAKLPDRISAEAHIEYKFHFKLGGCPPPMDNVCDPTKQPKYPTPSNLLSTTLLQNPETPIEYYLSSFDQRRDTITRTAAKRLKKDTAAKEHLFSSTGQTTTEVPLRLEQATSSEETSEEEKDPETLQFNIKQQRRKQRNLRKRILELLKLTANT
nr:MAG: ORF1 [TTV-like mini virus]